MPPCALDRLAWLNSCKDASSSTASIEPRSSTPTNTFRNIEPSSATTTAASSGKFVSSDYAALLVGTVSGGLVLICITISLCFWSRKRLETRRRQRTIERLRRQDSLRNRRSRWHNNSEEQFPAKSFNEKYSYELEKKDTGLPLMPQHVFKFEDMPQYTDPFIDCIVDNPYEMPNVDSSKPAGTKSKRISSHLKKNFGADKVKNASIKSAIIEEGLFPAPLEPKRQQPFMSPLPSAKLAPPKNHRSSRPSLTALPPLDTVQDAQMQQKEDSTSPITGELLPARAFSRNRRNPIRKSLIPIYFMGKQAEEPNGQSSKRGTLLSQSAARLHSVLFGPRNGGASASANCYRSQASSVYTTIESTDSVYGSLLPDSRRVSHSRGKGVRFPVRPIPSSVTPNSNQAGYNDTGVSTGGDNNTGISTGGNNINNEINGKGKPTSEGLARMSRASRSSEALPKTMRVRFKTPSAKRNKERKHSAYRSSAPLMGHSTDAGVPPPVPPKTGQPFNTAAARHGVGASPAGKSSSKRAHARDAAHTGIHQAAHPQASKINVQGKVNGVKLQHDADGRPYEQHEDFRIDFI